jgi:hypothetical protein
MINLSTEIININNHVNHYYCKEVIFLMQEQQQEGIR